MHLVCVYGKSQVGKTTLILNMIGLKDDKCKMEVSEVLRGGVARGNSSTSTAIIYSQSDSDLYGVRVEALDGNAEPTEYFTSDGMCRKLQSVRKKVEENSFSNKSILHIFIPKDYFSKTVSNSKISILDLPGVESRNVHEKPHVESLMTRYIPISSVCIIACLASDIQSLEKEEMPNGLDWKKLPHKYLVVLTKSYSNGSIKSYFDKSREEREKGFLEYIQDSYRAEMSEILGNKNKTEIFPLEFGDSFERLLSEELKNEEDCSEIRQTRDYVLSSLLESMIKNKGEQLLSIIKELRIIVEQSDEKKLLLLEEKKQKDVKSRNETIQKKSQAEEKLDKYENEKQKVESTIVKLDSLYRSIDDILTTDVPAFSAALINKINIENLSKKRNGDIYFYDKDKVVLNTISSNLSKISIVSKAQLLMLSITECNLNIDLYESSIANSIYDLFVYRYETKLYPPPRAGIWGKIRDIKDKWFGTGCMINLNTAREYINGIKVIIKDEIKSSVVRPCEKIICDEKEKLEKEKNSLYSKIIKRKKHIEFLEQDIDKYKKEIEDNEKYMKSVEAQKEQDIRTLNTYLKYAEVAYMRQRNDILNRINSGITSEEKLLNVLFLGVVDRDYETIKNASNG